MEYDDLVAFLVDSHEVHLSLPIQEDYEKSRGVFPVIRAMAAFEDLVHGGQGDWSIPEEKGREDFWWHVF